MPSCLWHKHHTLEASIRRVLCSPNAGAGRFQRQVRSLTLKREDLLGLMSAAGSLGIGRRSGFLFAKQELNQHVYATAGEVDSGFFIRYHRSRRTRKKLACARRGRDPVRSFVYPHGGLPLVTRR